MSSTGHAALREIRPKRGQPPQPPPPSPPRSSSSSGRSAIACEECRRLKVKCDGRLPQCNRCRRKAITGPCDYRPQARGTPNRRLRDENESLRRRIESLEQSQNLAAFSQSALAPSRSSSASGQTSNASNSILGLGGSFLPHPTIDGDLDQETMNQLTIAAGSVPHFAQTPVPASGAVAWHPSLQEHPPALPMLSPDGTQVVDEANQHQHAEQQTPALIDPTLLQATRTDQSPEASALPWWQEPRPATAGPSQGFGNLPFSSAVKTAGYPKQIQDRQLLNFQVAEHTVPSLLTNEESTLSKALTGFRDFAFKKFAEGESVRDVLDVGSIDVELLFRDRTPDDPFTVAAWASELCRSFQDKDWYLLLAGVVSYTGLMRWMLLPTAENYGAMTPNIRPLRSQRLVPHPPAAELCKHPALREALMHNYRDFVTPQTTSHAHQTVDWPHGVDGAIERSLVDGRRKVKPAFIVFMSDLSNWSVGESILNWFPEVEGLGIPINIRRPARNFTDRTE